MMDVLMLLGLAAGFVLIKLLADWCGKQIEKQ